MKDLGLCAQVVSQGKVVTTVLSQIETTAVLRVPYNYGKGPAIDQVDGSENAAKIVSNDLATAATKGTTTILETSLQQRLFLAGGTRGKRRVEVR